MPENRLAVTGEGCPNAVGRDFDSARLVLLVAVLVEEDSYRGAFATHSLVNNLERHPAGQLRDGRASCECRGGGKCAC